MKFNGKIKETKIPTGSKINNDLSSHGVTAADVHSVNLEPADVDMDNLDRVDDVHMCNPQTSSVNKNKPRLADYIDNPEPTTTDMVETQSVDLNVVSTHKSKLNFYFCKF